MRLARILTLFWGFMSPVAGGEGLMYPEVIYCPVTFENELVQWSHATFDDWGWVHDTMCIGNVEGAWGVGNRVTKI